MREATTAAAVNVRRHDIDRLRILAVLALFPFHSARVFDGTTRGTDEPEESPVLSWTIVRFLDPWHSPLLFVQLVRRRGTPSVTGRRRATSASGSGVC